MLTNKEKDEILKKIWYAPNGYMGMKELEAIKAIQRKKNEQPKNKKRKIVKPARYL